MTRACTSIILFTLILVNCQNERKHYSPDAKNTNTKPISEIQTYEALTIPDFFKEVVSKHGFELAMIYDEEFKSVSTNSGFVASDTNNWLTYSIFRFTHEVFTSSEAKDCSVGEVLRIPYLWHWIDPNPRKEIFFLPANAKLSTLIPQKEFSNYLSCAEIDRTPFVFLSELFSDQPSYYTASCDTFYTFGSCSEREMAYVCLLEMLGYQGKVVAEGNHSWSEFKVPMTTAEGSTSIFNVRIDNTFNKVQWSSFLEASNEKWENLIGDAKQAKWYNSMAHSEFERLKSKNVSHLQCRLQEWKNPL